MGKLKELARESIHGKQHDVFSPKEDEKTGNGRISQQELAAKHENENA